MAETNIYGEEIVDTTGKPVETAGTFDDLKQDFDEARTVFKGNRGIVLQALEDYGASKTVQAAILGDIEQESSFNPTLDDHNDPTGAHGLLQVGTPMFREFDAKAQAQGLKRGGKDYVYAQVPFMLDYFRKRNPERWEEMQKMTNAADVVEVFRGDHEGWGYGIAGKRHAYANKFQNLLAGVPSGYLAAESTGAADNPTFGDLLADQEEIDTTQPPPALQLGEEDNAVGADYGDTAGTTPAAAPDVEIPDFLKEPEEEEEEPAAAAPRMRTPIQVGGEVPTEFKVDVHYPAMTQIPTTAAEPAPLIPLVEGAIQEPVQAQEAPQMPAQQQPPGWGEMSPLQQKFADMGKAVADVLPTEQVPRMTSALWNTAKGMVPTDVESAKSMALAQSAFTQLSPQERVNWLKELGSAGLATKENLQTLNKEPIGTQEWWNSFVPTMAQVLPLLGAVRGPKPTRAAGLRAGPKAKATAGASELPEFMGLTKEQMNELQYGRRFAEVGPQRARSELQQVRPDILLRGKLKAARKAGRAGYRRGSKEAKATAEELRKAEKEAGKAEMRRQRQQLEAKAKADAADIRETLQTADRWLDADINDVLAKLRDFSKHLPLEERGKLNNMFARVARKPAAWTRNPERIRKEAEKALNRMAEMVYQVNQKRLTKDITKGLQKIIDSPTVHVSQRRVAREMLKTFNTLKGFYTLDHLEAVHKRMKNVEAMGRDLYHVSEVMKAEATIAAKREIDAQGVLKADLPEHYLPPIEEVPSWWRNEIRKWKNLPARLKHFNFTTTAMDWQFVRYDGRFSGAAYRNMKLPVDILTSEFFDTLHFFQDQRIAIKEKYKFDERNYRRIATHTMLRQEGGLENLIAKGYKEADVLPYKDVNSLSAGEQALLKVDDKILQELYPLMRDMYAQHYNIEVGPSPVGYYPWIRDWEAWSELDITQKGGFRQTKTESGFTKERQKGAKSVNILDSDLIMNQHLEDVLWTVKLGPEISRLARLVKDPWFKDRFGTFGQQQFLDYVDTLARNGGVEATRRFAMLDTIKRNIGVGYLGFKLVTGLLQPIALLMSLPHTTIRSMTKGISTMASDHKWILKTFPEVRESVIGGRIDDPAYANYTGGFAKASMAHIRYLDGFARMTAVDAFYRDALAKRNIPYDRNAVPHPEAVAEAQRLVRMTQSGPLAKDTSQALSRGALTGSISVDQAVFQFQSYIMIRWDHLKYASGRIGTKEGNVATRAKIFGYVMLATYIEQLGREGIVNIKRAIIGMGEKEASTVKKEQEEGLALTISKKAFFDLITSAPGLTNITGRMRYGSSGTPVGDTIGDLFDGGLAFVRGKQTQGAITALSATLAMKGVPVSEIKDIVQRLSRESARQGDVGPYEDAYRFGPGPDLGLGGGAGPGPDVGPGPGY